MKTDSPDLDALKERLKATWSAGDYGLIARGLEQSAEDFLADKNIASGERVLDAACGTGQLAIPAARRGAAVTGLDIAAAWIGQARDRAEAEALDIRFDVADAEAMPYPDGSFDVVLSLIGVMFAPRPERVVSELLRVCRPGGRIILGNWTREGLIGTFFQTVGQYAPPPDMPSPLLWGDEEVVRARLGHGVHALTLRRRMLRFDYPMPPADLADHFLTHFGPTQRAAAALDDGGRQALRGDLERLWAARNAARDGGTEVEGEILEVMAVRG
jgi:SAM-dependent methyltransferase